MKELKLGKITTAELAEWFNVSKATLQNRIKTYLPKLEQYCSFHKVYGGIYVEEIYIYKYDKNLNLDMNQIYVDEIKNTENGLSTVSGMARKLQKDLNLSESVLRKQITRSRDMLFGQFSDNMLVSSSGIVGDRERIWAIKLGDNNQYRYLTEEEQEIVKMLYCMKSKEKDLTVDQILDDMMLESLFRETEMTKEQYLYFKDRETTGYNFYKDVIEPFRDLTGEILVKVNKHNIQYGVDFQQSINDRSYKEKLLGTGSNT